MTTGIRAGGRQLGSAAAGGSLPALPWHFGEGQQYTTTTTSHTPRWPAPSAPHGPAQPPFASAIASSASNQVAPLFFSQCR